MSLTQVSGKGKTRGPEVTSAVAGAWGPRGEEGANYREPTGATATLQLSSMEVLWSPTRCQNSLNE